MRVSFASRQATGVRAIGLNAQPSAFTPPVTWKGGSHPNPVGSRRTSMDAIYDPRMVVSVGIQAVSGRPLAAVRRSVRPGDVGSSWGPAVDTVWDFLPSQPGLWASGHNIFVYHHAEGASAPLVCDFGVEVTGPFEGADEVFATETPTGEAVVAVYRGPYDGLHEAYDAISVWTTAHARRLLGTPGRSTEIRRPSRRTR
jgi:hypothetical protein